MNPFEQSPVVANMFKHLHGNHPVVGFIRFEGVYIRGDNREVGQLSFLGLSHDVFPLRIRIGYRSNRSHGEVFGHP